mmetsp:Transcript_4092/g.9760  ORF Transcript_4092/g.9760 Transcript_4092/m.9760 type:complete len:170 (-) Transcript_4092:234-743(-)|eukprot:CAMPEP_0116098882 /NCGR_PEP_ID=MMETSP0327-20121206/11472_1 /TAXON_ID=44447 /ORGANISM="Pseudo-nitzschia delicatissima, Strain B596" /LENGTH=169 /DNA_ID=CAMNT_0003590723 /DNA_START=152 /DNA_END=661 /DNA_ORIENTATION=+
METALTTIPTCNPEPNKRIEHTTIIDAPVKDVWKALIDVHDWSWNKWTKLDCTEAPEKGLTGKLRACYEGDDEDWQTFDFEFAEVVENETLAWEGNFLGECLFHGYHTMKVQPCEDDEKKTQLVHTEIFGGLLPMIHLGLPYAKLDRNYRLINEALKKHVEKKTKNSEQ